MAYMSKVKKRRVRKQRLIRLAIALAIIAVVLIVIWQASLGSVMAKVNGTPIRSSTVESVEAFLEYIQTGQFPGGSTAGMSDEEIKTKEDMALVQLNSILYNIFITHEVLKAHFAAEGIEFPTAEQQEQIDQYVESYFGSPEGARVFEANGVKIEHVTIYFEYVTLVSAFRDNYVEANPVSEEDAFAYYEENKQYFVTPVSLRASHILILDADHTPEKRAEIQQILDRLNEGEDFAELAMMYSEDGSAEAGGDLGSFGLGEMVPEFEEAALALEPGEISGIVETQFGFHIILLTEKNPETVKSFDEVRDQIDSILSGERATGFLNELIAAADIVYKVLVNPTTGKPPMSLAELEEARIAAGLIEAPAEEETAGAADDHEGHDHD